MQLTIPLSRGSEPLFRQVYRGMRQAILGGALGAGERLPSTRDLAEQLGISRSVVVLAYEHLLVKPSDLSRVNAAFFTINGYISVLFFLTWAAAILFR